MNAAKQELFESVRAVVAGRLRDEAQVREIAYRVSEESTSLRRRVDRAVGYARAGLRLEACAEAEAEPTVFELASAFDADHMRQWKSMCAKNRLPVQDEIPPESIAEIEEAIAFTAPLRSRLALMRRLVLSDASAWHRLEVLRELVSRDPDNPAWQEDRAALEPVAANELGDRFEDGLKDGNLADAELCVARLEDGRWHWSGAAKVAAQLRGKLDRALAARAVEEARAVVARLDSEWQAESEDGARAAIAEYRGLEQRALACGGDMPADLADRVLQAEDWLAGRDAAADALRENRDRVAALERLAQDQQSTLAALRTALRAAEQTSEGVPDDVRSVAERRIGELERAVRLRRVGVIAAAVVVVAGAVVAAGIALKRSDEARRIDEASAAILSNVDAGRFEEADRLLDEAGKDPVLGPSAKVADARAALGRRRAEIADRRSQFKVLMAEAGDPASEAAKPDRVDEARKLVQDEDEQRAVADWIRRNGRAIEERRSARVTDGVERAKAVVAEILAAKPSAEASWDGEFDAWEKALADVQRKWGEFDAVMEEVREGRTALAAQRGRTESARAEIGRLGKLAGLGASAGSPAQLADALESYAKEHPDTPEARDFTSAAAALPAWEAVVAWSRVQPVPTAALAQRPQKERDAAAAAMRTHREQHPASPYAAACAAAEPLLGTAPNWRPWLDEKLGSMESIQLFMVERKDGSRWYCRKDPAKEAVQTQGGVAWKSILAIQGRSMKEGFERFEPAQTRFEGPSPQKAFAAQLKDLLDNDEKSVNDVDAAFDALAALRDNESVDGALLAVLARGLVETMAPEMPEPVRADMEKAAKRIAREKADEIDWMNPRDADARARSRAARNAVREGLQVDLWRKACTAALAAACKPMADAYVPAGVLVKPDGTPRVLGVNGVRLDAGAALWVAEPPVGDRPGAMVRLGTVKSEGEADFTTAVTGVPAGTMVFVPRPGGKP